MILIITTCIGCPNMCNYCPQELFLSKYKGTKVLTLENFKKLLKNIPKEVILDFSGYSEPFMNQECADMIVYSHNQGYKVQVFTTLVGFTKKDAKKLKDIPFERFSFHDIGNADYTNYSFITDTIIPIQLNQTSRAGALSPRDWKPFVWCKMDTNANNTKPFHYNQMTPNGDVYLCCMDWGLKHKLGNLYFTNYMNLKRDKEYELCHYCEYAKNE